MSTNATADATCWEDLIGLRGVCNEITPKAGLWADDIGLTKQLLADFLTKDFKDEEDLWLAKQRIAIRQITDRINSVLSPKFRGKTLLDDRRLGFRQDAAAAAVAGPWRGWEIDMDPETSHLVLTVSSVTLHLATAGTYEVRLTDLLTGEVLGTDNVDSDGVAPATIYPHWQVRDSISRKLMLAYAPGSALAYTTSEDSGGGCGSCRRGGRALHRFVTIYGKSFIGLTTAAQTGGGGLSAQISLGCDHQRWLCAHGVAIALPLLYRIAAEVYTHGIMAASLSRFNPGLYGGVEAMTQTRDALSAQSSNLLNEMMQNMVLPNDSTCFHCDRPTIILTELP